MLVLIWCFWICFRCLYYRWYWTGCIFILIFKTPFWFFSKTEIRLAVSSTAPLQYSCYYKWCHFSQDRHKQTVSSELPIVIKLAIFQTIQSLSQRDLSEPCTQQNRSILPSMHYRSFSGDCSGLLFKFCTISPEHLIVFRGRAQTSQVGIWDKDVSSGTCCRAETERVKSTL